MKSCIRKTAYSPSDPPRSKPDPKRTSLLKEMEQGIYRCSTDGCHVVGEKGDFVILMEDSISINRRFHALCRRCVKMGFKGLLLRSPDGVDLKEVDGIDVLLDEILVFKILDL